MLGIDSFGSDYAEAIQHFERAAELDSTFLAPRLFMVFSYANQGRYAKADSLLDTLKRDRQRLTDYQCLYVDFLEALYRHNDAESLRLLRQLEITTPNAGNINYLIGLTAIRLNRPRETLDTYEQYEMTVDHGRYGFGWWKFSYWADAHHMLGEYQEGLQVVHRGREIYPDVEWLRTDELMALAALGKVDKAMKVVDECMALSDEQSFRCHVITITALELRAHGQADAALKLQARADALHEDLLADESSSETDRHYVARMLYAVERWKESRALLEDLSREHPDNIDYIGNLGCLAARRGDREGAEAISQQLAQIKRPYLFGENTYWRACIASLLDEREQAVELLREALAQGQRHGVGLHRDLDLLPLHDYPPFQELLRPKG
jgi:tetratricopeptide (TPR) repeat protein